MTTTRRRNHALWAAPLLAVFGFGSYWALFSRWPALSDFPWVNLGLLAGALALCVVGLRRAWPRGILRRLVAVGNLLLTLSLGYMLGAYCFSMSYQLPESEGALDVGMPAPSLSLTDQHGQLVEVAAPEAGTLLLVFYRGFW